MSRGRRGERRRASAWLPLPACVLLALGVYAAGILLLAWGTVLGVVGEGGRLPALAVLAAVSTLVGAMAAVCRCPRPAGLLTGAAVLLICAAAGAACWGGVAWNGGSGVLALCILGAGAAAEAAGGRRGQRKRDRRDL